MPNEICSTKTLVGRVIWVAGILLSILLINFAAKVAMASSQERAWQENGPSLAVQDTATPISTLQIGSTSAYSFSLATLGYDEITLASPYGVAQFSFRIPDSWLIEDDGIFNLDLSYVYDQISAEDYPALYGDLAVTLDNQTLKVFPIDKKELDHYQLYVPLPSSLLANSDRTQHIIELRFNAGLLCEIPHRANLVVHPTSTISLTYSLHPLVPDLSRYPWPFYQQAFEPDNVNFVLPSQLTTNELSNALAVAARLGALSSGMSISGTTDLELINHLEEGEAPREHLIVIGTPDSNQVILELNQLGVLPMPFQTRQLSLASEGPAAVAPGSILTYTLTLTNTDQDAISSLTVVDRLPAYGQLVTCTPSCVQATTGEEVTWSVGALRVGEVLRYTLELRLSQVITDSVVENTVVLLDAASNPINVDTLTTTVSSVPQPESDPRSSISASGGFFFVQGDWAVPESDGIVQEIVSPWDQTRAILVITGLNDEAVYKASQALSTGNRFPGMEGSSALVREVRPLAEFSEAPAFTDMTFAELGYDDSVLKSRRQEVNYYFTIPIGWRLTEEAYLDLRFSHSELIDYNQSFLNVSFNGQPIAGIPLDDNNALNGNLKISLPSSQARPGQRNKVSVQVEMHPANECGTTDLWLLIGRESALHLDHSQQNAPALDLELYSYPFDRRSDLADVLFVLPPEPHTEEWIESLQLVAGLGRAAGGPGFAPAVALGDTWPGTALGDYHFIVIGRPSRNPVLQRVNAQLPQPFLPDSDVIEQNLNEVVLRLPPDVDLGYLQLLPSPWNEERAFLAVTGTSDLGVAWAARLLTNRPWAAGGDLTLIQGERIHTIDTRELTRSGLIATVGTAVPELTPVAITPTPAAVASANISTSQVTATVTPKEQSTGGTLPTWLIPLVVIMIAAALGTLAVALRQARRR
jgi:uncharacterized repeat protein (TIGR01451 family)